MNEKSMHTSKVTSKLRGWGEKLGFVRTRASRAIEENNNLLMSLLNHKKAKLKRVTTKTLFATTVAFAFLSCSSGPVVQNFPNTANPNEEVAKLDTDINVAIGNQVRVLSPSNFEEAEDSLKDAKRSLDKKKDAKDTLHYVAQSRAYLNDSNQFAKLSHTNIEEVIVARQQSIEAGAPSLFSDDFKDADNDLRDITSDIEKNKLEKAKENRSTLQLTYLDLELKSIKQSRLGQSRDAINKAIKEGAKTFAPISLAKAEKSVLDTDAFITANRHNAEQINIRSDETRKSAEHVLKITQDAKSGNKTSSEELALRMESEQNKVADTQVKLEDKQDQLNATENQLDNKQRQLDKGVRINQVLVAQNVGLEKEQNFNEKYEAARSEFTEKEAEVYKQGDTLTIRLKGLDFPVSKAVLKGSNFPLLAKVQKVIKNFGKSSVIVQGHTDSVGGLAINERISTERAQAVRDYLLSNAQGGQPVNIEAVGYGYQKPLATNKTKIGRSQNRRVDILIQPERGGL